MLLTLLGLIPLEVVEKLPPITEGGLLSLGSISTNSSSEFVFSCSSSLRPRNRPPGRLRSVIEASEPRIIDGVVDGARSGRVYPLKDA